MRLPLYPAWLSFVAGRGLGAARVARGVAATLSIPAGFFLAAELGGPWAGALTAVALVAPGWSEGSADLTLEPFYGLTLLLFVLALARWRRRGTNWDALGACVAFAFAASTRSTILPLLPAAAVLGAWALGAREAARRGLLLCVAAAFALAPWALRNRAVYGRALAFEGAGSAMPFWAATAGRDSSPSDFNDPNQVDDEAKEVLRRARGLDDAARASYLISAARARVAAAPLAYASCVARRLPQLWAEDWPWLAGGLLALASPAGGAAGAVAVLPAAALTLHAAGAVRPRYAWPAVPALAALLCAGLVAALSARRSAPAERIEREAGAFLLAALLLLAPAWCRGLRALAVEAGAGPPSAPDSEKTRAQARGVELVMDGDWAGARKAFDAILAKKPDDAEALVSRGLLLDRIGGAGDAERDLAAARRLVESR